MSLELDGLVRSQTELLGRISRAYENYRKAGASRVTLGVLEARLNGLDSNWAKFEANHQRILALTKKDEELDYFKLGTLTSAEEAFLQQKAIFLDLVRSLKSKETESESSRPLCRTARTQVQVPSFSGKYEDWPAFRDLFSSVVGQDQTLTPVERLHLLKTSLKGEAELLIRHIPVTSANFERAWKLVAGYYENKRHLVRAYLDKFLAVPKLKRESAAELRQLFHNLRATVNSLESIGRPITNSADLFVHLAVNLLDHQTRREWERSIEASTDPPEYGTLEKFLERYLHTLEAVSATKIESATVRPAASGTKQARSHSTRKVEETTEKRSGRCSLCTRDHFLLHCEEYRRKTPAEKLSVIRDRSLCLNCLGRHEVAECESRKNCSACGARHHSTVHDACRAGEMRVTSQTAGGLSSRAATVLLATARVLVADRFGERHLVRALIDQGSECSMVSERLAQRLGLKRAPAAVAVFGIGGSKAAVSRSYVELAVSKRTDGPDLIVKTFVLPKLTAYTGRLDSAIDHWPHLVGLELADPDYAAADAVDVLFGAEVFASIILPGLKKGAPSQPVAQNTSLGWILSGHVGPSSSRGAARSFQCRVDDELIDLVRGFWAQEELSLTRLATSAEDEACERHFCETHSRSLEGRYRVRLPLKEPLPDFSGSWRLAVRMLEQTERKFRRDPKFQEAYQEFMQQYQSLGHMTVAPDDGGLPSRSCYLPHHGVLRESSITTRLRVVFNGSARASAAGSLNQFLMTGANLLPALSDILLRWRRHRFAVAADIEKMYRQIEVDPQDRGFQQVLWRDGPELEIRAFQLNTVTYGLSCAPFLAIRTLRQLALDEGAAWPLAAAALTRDTYMDDVLTGGPTVEAVQEIRSQLTQLCRAGGFPLRKWSASDPTILEGVDDGDLLRQGPLWWLPSEEHSTLGLRWHPCRDEFSFASPRLPLEKISRRTVLSLTARLFDPLGWLAPVTTLAKIWIQSSWLLGIDWDAPLPEAHARRWTSFHTELPSLEAIRVPRWLGCNEENPTAVIHGFADASERAFAAVAYLRSVDRAGRVDIQLIAAKTKVAPLKPVTLPQLELCASALLARLVAHLRGVLGVKEAPVLWSDSTVALGWIRTHPSQWKTYIANRVSEIQTSVPEAVWRHIPGRDNPADCASRGLPPAELRDHPLWWNGPAWLSQAPAAWPVSLDAGVSADLPERRARVHASRAASSEAPEDEILHRFSDWRKLCRVTAWCLRWRSRRAAAALASTESGILTVEELEEARLRWIRAVQGSRFAEEIASLSAGRPLPTRGGMDQLSPFRDDKGLLRVGGRLANATLSFDRKHPVILPCNSHLTALIVEACHRRTLHGGVQLTLSALRQDYWVPRGRSLVKRVIFRCVTCVRWRASSPQPRMGNLPAPRVTPSRPFLHTGLDYAGPVWLRSAKGRGQHATKGFLVIFVCLSSKAVHLDVASDYSADAVVAALRRLMARRGICHTIYSDCGTNFVGADAQLRGFFAASHRESQRIAQILTGEQIRWRFNPPAAPNFGGLWEAAVRSTKHHLRRLIGENRLTFEEMSTLLAQIEACLNSRPLAALSDDPADLAALTPGHFLIGEPLIALPEPSLSSEPTRPLARWRLLQQIKDHFWDRWSREYLHALAHRPKWTRPSGGVQVGRLCLIRSECAAPTRWPLARVVELFPGDDGQVRVVRLRTATGELTRPVSKLVLLPAGGDPCD